ncbi:xanthine dehydrogenase family protein molybdopterin-binding subunit [Anaerosphaera multitolerans]|uniref:Xanthine dehydrogenase family protein molybdopterin-binding subunit n=1 Tax=Anaerosphaera multitolerans TaxID=2487351 RepID=A0A437S8E2_9FIRM|nr:molybdopterin cofactor-binding domain-containing protein [Anaerosphaera multitolerans]RVU55353.1 xanthine dehydrogenase family protein molybdopterin-binding subunit [Anaerosphaera multitolerans]
MSNYKYVGKSIIREDSLERVTGKTKYLADVKRHNMLYGKLVLSEKPHADVEFDFEEALKVEGIERIFTHADVPKNTYNTMEWFTGIEGKRDEYILNDRARYVGDRIALVLGSSKDAVEEAVKKVKVIYHELPVVVGLDMAKEDKVIVKGSTNLGFKREFGTGDYEKAKSEADYIVIDEGSTPRNHHLAIEPHIALGEVDEMGNLIVSSPSQMAFAIQMHLSRVLEIPYSKVRAIKSNMGGSFGGKQQPILETIAGFAAWELKRPVLVYMDREQSIMGTVTRNPTRQRIETAVKKDGTILGRKVEVEVDGGAYDTNNSSVTNALAKKLFRLYKFKNQEFSGRAYYSNAIPGGATRAYGGPQAHAITEINITNVAKAIGMDPCEFRLKNLIDPYDEDPTGGPNLGKAAIKECIIQGMEAFNWKEKYNHIREKNTDRYAYGVGVASVTHSTGYWGTFPDFTNVEMIVFEDSSVLAKIAVHEQGCGTLTTLTQMAAEALDLDVSKIRVTEADTFITPYDSAGTQASRVTSVCGGALKEAGEKVVEKLLETLSKVKGYEVGDLYTDNGKIKVKNSDEEFTYGEIAVMREKNFQEQLSVYVSHESTGNPASLAACFAEVKVDKKTGFVEVTDFLSVNDIGRAVNPMLVEGQVHGGCQFVLGMALCEEIVIDDKGYIKNPTLSKYHSINVHDMPDVKTILIESDDELTPYGVKSIGEISAVAPAPAVLNAINHALGTNITDYPANPERIIASLEELKKGGK